ncbi:MAG TPA: hypothetical protein VHE36_08660 [Sphingomicrobium sp.]|nr:hypothetical protein [Sphingomicrobium sp.]
MSDELEWFRAKRIGFGPGVPIRWQGWALTIGFVAVSIGISLAFRKHPLQLVAAIIPLIVVFLVISCRTTRGGCRWSSGKEE